MEPNKSIIDLDSSGNEYQVRITIPKPFSFEQREKERQMARSQQKPLELVPEESKFKATPVPEKVKTVGLFEKIITDQQKKN